MNEIKLGSKVTDTITGFKGIATARVEYINGCIQYCVTPKADEKNKMPEGYYIDESQLVVSSDESLHLKNETPSRVGGPQRNCPKH